MWAVSVQLGDVGGNADAERAAPPPRWLMAATGEYTVGRPAQGKGGRPDIVVEDRSISRVHAVFLVEEQPAGTGPGQQEGAGPPLRVLKVQGAWRWVGG